MVLLSAFLIEQSSAAWPGRSPELPGVLWRRGGELAPWASLDVGRGVGAGTYGLPRSDVIASVDDDDDDTGDEDDLPDVGFDEEESEESFEGDFDDDFDDDFDEDFEDQLDEDYLPDELIENGPQIADEGEDDEELDEEIEDDF